MPDPVPPTLAPAPAPPAPAAPAAELPALIPPTTLDPFLQKLVKSFETTLDRPIDLSPAVLDPVPERPQPSRSLTEALDEFKRDNPTPPAAPAVEDKTQGAATLPVATPDAPASPPKVQQSEADKLREELDRLPAPVPAPDPAPEEEVPKEEDSWLSSLSEAQRDEIELATFAENKYPQLKGKRAETINWLKQVQAWAAENPDADPDGDAFTDFNDKIRPRYEGIERRKIERAQLEDQILAKAEETNRERYAEIKRKQYELEIRPQVDKAKTEFAETMSTTSLPEGVPAIDQEVLQAVRNGTQEAYERFPIEAPIVHSTIQAGREYLDISTGIKEYEPSNPTHQWLGKFMYDQGQILKQKSKEVRMVDGKEFLPRHEYADLVQKDPQAAQKHWTFSDGQILDMLKVNAAIAIGSETQRLQKAGWARTPNVKTQTPAQNGHATAPLSSPPATSAPNPPRAGSSIGVGEASNAPASSAESKFFEALLPGSSKVFSK